MPMLTRDDTVLAAGAPEMVAAVQFLAAATGATCYADPFYAAARGADGRPPSDTNFLQRFLQRVAGHRTAKTEPVA
ncbi:hypothetical protein ACU4GR_14620 [Methylobacterium oryzae CBMB20]